MCESIPLEKKKQSLVAKNNVDSLKKLNGFMGESVLKTKHTHIHT